MPTGPPLRPPESRPQAERSPDGRDPRYLRHCSASSRGASTAACHLPRVDVECPSLLLVDLGKLLVEEGEEPGLRADLAAFVGPVDRAPVGPLVIVAEKVLSVACPVG